MKTAFNKETSKSLSIRILIFFLLLSNAFVSTATAATNDRDLEIAMLIPKKASNLFFTNLTRVMTLAAIDLQIKLEFLYANDDPLRMLGLAKGLTSRAHQPDYVLVVGHRGAAENALRHLDSKGIATAVVVATLPPEQIKELRYGPNKLNHWLGYVIPNEQQAGYLLAEQLFSEARKKNLAHDGIIHTLVMLGSARAPASDLRMQGLNAYIKEHPDIRIDGPHYANWTEDLAAAITAQALANNKQISVVWSAGDEMAIGASKSAERLNRKPGQDILLGGVDWLPTSLDYIAQKKLIGSVGGHVYDGAWILVALYDQFHGANMDFLDIETDFSFINRENLPLLEKIMSSSWLERHDFKKYSKQKKQGKPYDFGVNLLLGEGKLELSNSAP